MPEADAGERGPGTADPAPTTVLAEGDSRRPRLADPVDRAATLVAGLVQRAPSTRTPSPDRRGHHRTDPEPLPPELTNHRYERLIAGHDDQLAPTLDVLRSEIQHVSNRRSNLNDALAWAAARWTVDQAIAAGATVIYVEDLRSMEAGGMGRTLNTRLSQQVRGQIADRMRHLATEQGIAVVTVPARNTSKLCPHCLTPLRHRKAPDRPTIAGWKWAICPHQECRWQGDRDHGAWRRIAARGLAHQATTVTDRTSGHMVIRTVLDNLEANAVLTPTPKTSRKDRTKTGPTRRRSTRPAPRRRRAPSPARPHGRAGQRPEGHAHTDRTRLPRAAHRHQGVNTISTPTTSRHRPQGAALGAGFHLHAHASPPRWERSRKPNPTQDRIANQRRSA
ncbi:zinc ribbon domain-containing protein [Streptomyces sp. CA-106110]|uniref:zinc ribbon domain-containing protein n=1 Tax=Streptomyces sp. CA-106110 TaxID=3240044 RepID=UPI003D91E663